MAKFIKVRDAYHKELGRHTYINVDYILVVEDVSRIDTSFGGKSDAMSAITVAYRSTVYALDTVEQIMNMIKEKENEC